ncbi:MAG: NAD(+) diphosphatase [Bacteroidaceae bacterium]|nr:NAD(+) diphosphatase [Bacteroidaceae bacterium]
MIRYFAFCQGDVLLTAEGNIPFGIQPPVALKSWNRVTTLHQGEDELQVIRLDYPVTGRDDLQMMGLRKTFQILSPEDYRLAGKCAELVYWDQQTRYCGVCGSPLGWQTDISKQCPECGKEWWPSLAVAIIVRVLRDDEILLVHARNFRGNHYGLVAGFVETGETLEQAVEREVWEETHLRIRNLHYFGSQPWPFPCGLMVGFTADYAEGEIKLQKEELGSGGWFRRDNLPQIPDKASIARKLIDDWCEKGEG